MSPSVAIALAYGIVWTGVLLYLFRLRRRVITAEASAPTSGAVPNRGERLGVR